MTPVLNKKRVGVLRGGPSSEHEVSMKSGAGVISALSELGYEVKDIAISKKGEWIVSGFVRTPQQALSGIDSVFIALHGSYGEDGTVQRILSREAIPYTGSGAFSSAIALNKVLTKEHVKKQAPHIKLAPHLKLTRNGTSNVAQVVQSIIELFGPEYVVKPLAGGSSIGTVLTDKIGLLRAVQNALQINEEILVEKRIRGKEATVGILEGFRDQPYYQLPAIEIVPPASASFFSYDVKYSGETQEICPGRFSVAEKSSLAQAALDVHKLLDLRQYSRSDFIVSDDGIYFLEVNTLPGLTKESLFPKSMEAVGSSYKELVHHLIHTATIH